MGKSVAIRDREQDIAGILCNVLYTTNSNTKIQTVFDMIKNYKKSTNDLSSFYIRYETIIGGKTITLVDHYDSKKYTLGL